MRRSFITDLDNALTYLYERQVTQEEETWRKKSLAAKGVNIFAYENLHEIQHSTCVKESELSFAILAKRKSADAKQGQGILAVSHLLKEGHIDGHREEGDASLHFRITSGGMLFHEGGGYRSLRCSSRRRRAWMIATTIAAAINATAVIWLTWRSAQSAAADTLKDEQIIQLDRKNATLEERNTNLLEENITIRLRLDSLVEKSSAMVPSTPNR
jgi:hypothetical protein